MTECNKAFSFPSIKKRTLVADFQGGSITSDGGLALLRQVDRKFNLIERLASCLEDNRDPRKIKHTQEELLRQRILQIALVGITELIIWAIFLRGFGILAAAIRIATHIVLHRDTSRTHLSQI